MANQDRENQPGFNITDEISETELQTQMLIGVCGAHRVGKTVFLTAVFQSIHLYPSSETNLVLFDRENKGGANYFENIERQIRLTGGTPGTLDIKLAQLLSKSNQWRQWYDNDILPVNLFDFAGDDFALLADLREVERSPDILKEQKERIYQINEYLERCDGLIVLIDSQKFKSDNVQPANNAEYFELPFPASVKYMIDSCVAKRRPLALVFTKKDQNPSLTLDKIKKFKLVEKMVLERFTADIDTAKSGTRPYGDFHLITCYETDPKTGRVKILDESQNIWTKSAATIFKSISTAALPRFKERYMEEMRLQEQKRNEIAAKKQKEKADNFKKKMRGTIAIIGLLVLLGSAFVYWNDFKKKKDLVHNDQLVDTIGSTFVVSPITIEKLEELKNIITKNRPLTPGKFGELLKKIASNLDVELNKEFNTDINKNLETCKKILELLSSQTFNEKDEKFFDIIDKRMKVLDWLNNTVKEGIRMSGNNIQNRLGRIDQLLTKGPLRNDSRLAQDSQIATSIKRTFAVLTVESILKMDENNTARNLLNSIFSGIDIYGDSSIPYNSIYERIESIGNGFSSYETLYNSLNSGLIGIKNNAESRRYLIGPIFQELFNDINSDQKHYLSNSIINALITAYIFRLGEDYKLAEMHYSVEALETKLNDSQNNQQDIFTNYFCGPVYQIELETVLKLLCKKYCQYWAIRDIRSFRSSMEYGTSELTPTYLDSIDDRMKGLKTRDWFNIKDGTDIFSDQRENFSRIQSIINRWNGARNSRYRQSIQDGAKTSLENLLRDLCNGTKRSGEGGCADVI